MVLFARNLNSMWREVETFNDHYFPGWRNDPANFLALDLVIEAGEVADVIKKMSGRGTNVQSKSVSDLKEEMVDTLYYLILIAIRHGITFKEFAIAFEKKAGTNRERMEAKKTFG